MKIVELDLFDLIALVRPDRPEGRAQFFLAKNNRKNLIL